MEVWLLRHGETEWSKSGRHTSVTDLELTPLGRKQATAAAILCADITFDQVLCSPRARARQTAALALAPALARDGQVHIVDDLAEWHYGDYEGLTSAEIHEKRPDWTIFADGAPGGETPADVSARVRRVIDKCLSAGDDSRTLLIAHGHILRALAAQWIEQPLTLGEHLDLDTATASVLSFDRGTPIIHRWNDPD